MIPVKGRVHQMQNWIKTVTVHGHYSCPHSTQKTLLVIIASNKAPVVELAKVVATNAKVISLLAL